MIFHLAAIVSGEAELDFDKGYRINLDGTRMLLDAIRLVGGGYKPRVVFTSSIAVFGAPFPDAIGDEFFHTPLLSYGTQKAIGELLLADYSRRGFLDGIGIRLPTICIRPGLPNKAASGFFSNILREPLAGKEAVLPVSEDVRHWHATPRSAVGFLLHAGTMDLATVGPRRNLTMPGLSATVGEQIAALEACRRRQGRRAHPARAGPVHHRHRRRLAAQFRAEAGARARLHHGREDLRRHHPHPHRGRARRQFRRLIATVNSADMTMASVACIGECMVELEQVARLPQGGGLYSRGFGGDTLNTAVYLARLGVKVDYLTALGDDAMSDEMIAAWNAEGVGTRRVSRLPGKLPGLYMIQTDGRASASSSTGATIRRRAIDEPAGDG